MKRTHTCGELGKDSVNNTVLLQGWVQSIRDHGGLLFCDLRDRYGLTQVVFDPAVGKTMFKTAESLRREFVIEIEGTVRARPEEMINPKMTTGEIEVVSSKLTVLNKSDTPPIEVDDRKLASDELRMKYRYLDLRRPQMQHHFAVRHKAISAARSYLNSLGFLEIETPILVKSTPEGARDYVVPSRVNAGQFWALPQSPQIYKEILMVSGFDRYYQIARCFRDEDLRADRQPEFTQLDLEMSFVTPDDIYEVIEGMTKEMFRAGIDFDLKIPFPRITFAEAMEKYGTDKPDLRFEIFLHDVSNIVQGSDFQVFNNVLKDKGMIKGVKAQGCAEKWSRKYIEGQLLDHIKEQGAQGLAWMKVENGTLVSSIVKFFSEDIQKELIKEFDAKDGDVLLFVADRPAIVHKALAHLRLHIAKELDLLDNKVFTFAWVVDYPLFEWDEEHSRWSPSHHIFTHPKKEHIELLESDPGKILSDCYDLVLNGIELASGSIRINEPELQQRVIEAIGISKEEADQKFGFLMESFKFGAPPHGGIAPGLDRMVALMCGFNDIREVVAFPKNKKAQCPMDGSPSALDEFQLKELHVKLDLVHRPPKESPIEKQGPKHDEGPTEDLIDE